VLASGGYPGKYEKGKEIKGLEKFEGLKDIFIFHAGTKKVREKEFITAGGRVLNVVGLGDAIKEAQQIVYQAIQNIYFENMHYRKDIGNKALKFFS
jgi:phosphoribosylamine--glycine ligase